MPTTDYALQDPPEVTMAVQAPAGASDDDVLLASLESELVARKPLVDLLTNYYEGRQRLAFATAKFREVFGQMLAAVSDNWMPLVVRATTERLHVQGFAMDAAGSTDKDAWEIWKRNELDEGADLAFVESVKHGESYLLVWFDDLDPSLARITAEHPAQFVVRRAPGDRTRIIGALKRWWDADADAYHGTFWTPDTVYRMKRGRSQTWWSDREPFAREPNPLGVVPVAPLVNDPQMLPCGPPQSLMAAPHRIPEYAHVGMGRSDLADVISTQDQINKLLCDLMVAAELAAFRQRWATGLEVPKDPETHEPIEPFRSAVNRLWISEAPDSKFGDFEATELDNYIVAIESRYQSIASRTRVPPHYMMGGMGQFPSGESLKAAETGLVAKGMDKQGSFGVGLRRAMGLAFQVEGRGDFSAAVDWQQMESRTESEYVDALVKKLSIGVPVQQLWQDYGYTPDQIDGFRVMLREYTDLGLSIQPPVAGAGQPTALLPEGEEG